MLKKSEPAMSNVEYMTANLQKLSEQRYKLALEHNFLYKRSRNYRNCVVIRWKLRKSRKPNFIDHERINLYTDFAHSVCKKYELYDEKHLLLSLDLMLCKIKIFCFSESHHWAWAIPNTNAEVKAFVLSCIPSWAEVVEKK